MLATLVSQHLDRRVGERAEALARRFERANDALIAAVARYPEQSWAATGRGWSAAAEARQVAEGHLALTRFIAAVASGRPLPPLRGADADGRESGARGDPGSKREVLDLLQTRGAAAARILRGLGDEQLEAGTSFFGAKLTAARLVDELLIAHVEEHASGIAREPSEAATSAPPLA